MYQIIVDVNWSSQSVYDEYNSYNEAKKALDELVNNDIYDRNRLCVVTKWRGGNEV